MPGAAWWKDQPPLTGLARPATHAAWKVTERKPQCKTSLGYWDATSDARYMVGEQVTGELNSNRIPQVMLLLTVVISQGMPVAQILACLATKRLTLRPKGVMVMGRAKENECHDWGDCRSW